MKKWSHRLEENIFKNHTFDERVTSRTYKELLKLKKWETELQNGQKIWRDTSPEKIFGWKVSIWKYVQHHYHRGMEIKTTMRYRYKSIRISNKQSWQYRVLLRMWNNKNSHTLLVRVQISIRTLEKSLAISYKGKHTLTIWPSSLALRNFPKSIENLCSQKKPYMDEWVNKKWYIHSVEYCSALKKNGLLIHSNMDES